MPEDNLHMTAMEITHSLTVPDIEHIVERIRPHIADITDYTFDHRTRIIKPMLSYDSAALALSFVPASGESLRDKRGPGHDEYTYHDLRRDLFRLCQNAGVAVASRYVVPSAHLTIARFNSQDVFGDEKMTHSVEMRQQWLEHIQAINDWLRDEYWPVAGGGIRPGGEWVVGEEKGLDCCKGTLWYGNGIRVRLGKAFEV